MICVRRLGIGVLRVVTSVLDDEELGFLTYGLEGGGGGSQYSHVSAQFDAFTIRCRRSVQNKVKMERREGRWEAAE